MLFFFCLLQFTVYSLQFLGGECMIQYVITFGIYDTETEHVFSNLIDAVNKMSELNASLPYIENIRVKSK